jgi:hypothetical protein
MVRGTRSTPAAARSRRRTRARGAAAVSSLGRSRRPSGLSIDSTRENVNQSSGVVRRSVQLPALAGSLPGWGPDSQVGCVADASRAISAPELPAPTTRTGPSRSWEGRR